MTAHRARSHARHYRATTARPIPAAPANLAHLHPDWLPPGGYNADGRYLDPTDDLDAPATGADPATHGPAVPPPPIPCPTGLPAAFNSRACPPATPLPTATDAPARAVSGSPSPAHGGGGWGVGAAPDEDEDAIFRDPYLPGGREAQLLSTALPLRHRIYALHCQGRSLSAIARRLRLDRGTVARHLHAVEDLLLAEQTEDLARLRLRAIEAQHAILAACWDALLCEELTESDRENEQPYKPRRAQLLATAARAARTAAQLQGLFTPAALAAALQSVGAHGCAPGPHGCAPAACPTTDPTAAPSSGTGLPAAFNSVACPTTIPLAHASDAATMVPAVSCGTPASAPVAASTLTKGLPVEFNSADGSSTTTLPLATGLPPQFNCGAPTAACGTPRAAATAAFCCMPASAAPSATAAPSHVWSTASDSPSPPRGNDIASSEAAQRMSGGHSPAFAAARP